MRKKSLLALLLVLVMALTGCALDVVNQEKDMARTVVDVNGETVSKQVITSAISDLTSQYEDAYNQYLMYYQYGLISEMPFSMPSEAQIQDSVIQSYVSNLVYRQKAAAEGFDQLTDEEKAAAEEDAKISYDSFIQSVVSTYLPGTTLEGDELTAEAEKFVAENQIVTADGRSTLADFIKTAEQNKAVAKLQASITDAVTVSEEELKADFDAHVDADKASFTVSEETAAANQTALDEAQQALTAAEDAVKAAAEDADLEALQAAVDAAQAQVTSAESAVKAAVQNAVLNYENAKNNGTTVYYNLPGYRKVQHILIPVTASEETTAANAALTDAKSAQTAAQKALDEAAEDADLEALQAAVEEAENQVKEAQALADAAAAADQDAAQALAQEVYEMAIAEGADFDALIKEYNQDGSSEGTFFYVAAGSESFYEGFVTAAMSVENFGDVSEPVQSDVGFHIVKYVDDVAEGAVDLEEIREELTAHILAEKQDEALSEALAQWISEADVKTYPEKLN